jgi:hypothetical protein
MKDGDVPWGLNENNFHFVFSPTDSTLPNYHEKSQTHVTNPVMSFSCILSVKSDITLYSLDSDEAENVFSSKTIPE